MKLRWFRSNYFKFKIMITSKYTHLNITTFVINKYYIILKINIIIYLIVALQNSDNFDELSNLFLNLKKLKRFLVLLKF